MERVFNCRFSIASESRPVPMGSPRPGISSGGSLRENRGLIDIEDFQFLNFNLDGFVKSRKSFENVIPAKAGIQ